MTGRPRTAVADWLGRYEVRGGLRWALGGLLTLGGAGCSSTNGVAGQPGIPDATPRQDESAAPSSDTGGVVDSVDGGDLESGVLGDGVASSGGEASASGGDDASAGSDARVSAGDVEAGTAEAASRADAEAGGGKDASGTTGCSGLFCEDFERGSLDPAIWSSQANGGQGLGVLETTVVAHGKYAIQFHANPGVLSYSFIITKGAPTALQGHHFGRAYFNVTPMPPALHTEYVFAGTAGFPNLKYMEIAGTGSKWQLTFVDRRVSNGLESYAGGGTIPLAHWFCMEWEFNDTPDQATVFVDGQQSFTFNPITYKGQSTGLVGGFVDFGFGFNAWHPATYPFDVYYDDIVLDTKRVGCLP